MKTTPTEERSRLESVYLYTSQIRQLRQLCTVSDHRIDHLISKAVQAFLDEHFEELLTQYADEFTSQALKEFKKQRQAAKPSK